MRRKQHNTRLNVFDVLFFGASAFFLLSAALHVSGIEDFYMIRERAAALVTGELSAPEVVRAFGTWGESDGSVATVFRAVDHEAEDEIAESYHIENGAETEVLFGDAELFPDTVDRMTYLIKLPCKTPTEGVVTSAFGERIDPISGEQSFHYGIDIAADEDVPIHAVSDGYVAEIGNNSYGNYIVIAHDNGLQSLYAHCNTVNISEGDYVKSGEEIAAVGMTGRATGNHLHFELWRAGKILDPTAYLEL